MTAVIITSDPGDKQGQYLAFVTPNRTFCHVIRTITGNATVETYNHKLTKKPEDSVTAKVK